MGNQVQDVIFSYIETQCGGDALIAAKYALNAILQPARPDLALKPRAARAAWYLHGLYKDKTEALHAIYVHLLEYTTSEHATSKRKIPRRGQTLLSQMVSADKTDVGAIVRFSLGGLERVAAEGAGAAAGDGAAEGAAEGDGAAEGEGDADGEANCIYNSGVADDDFCHGELLPVSKNELQAAAKTAAELLGLTQSGLKTFRRSLKLIPRASLRAYSQHANINSIDCYTSSRIISVRETRLSSFINAAKNGVQDAEIAVDELEKRSDVDRALVALMLPAVYSAGTFVRLARLDTLALSRVVDAAAKIAARALEDDAVVDALALDARVDDAIYAAAAGEKPKRQSPRKRSPGSKACNKT